MSRSGSYDLTHATASQSQIDNNMQGVTTRLAAMHSLLELHAKQMTIAARELARERSRASRFARLAKKWESRSRGLNTMLKHQMKQNRILLHEAANFRAFRPPKFVLDATEPPSPVDSPTSESSEAKADSMWRHGKMLMAFIDVGRQYRNRQFTTFVQIAHDFV